MDLSSLMTMPLIATLGYAAAFLVALMLIVFIHEYGHFKVARLCGVKVEIFSIGFGREIWGFTDRHGTRWKLGWLPLGGFVKFEGDANATSLPTTSDHKPTSPGDFHAKPVWQRAAVVVAGPMANFLLAIALFSGGILYMGKAIPGPQIGAVVLGEPAEQGGLRAGDLIRSINGSGVGTFDDVVVMIRTHPGETLKILAERDGSLQEFSVHAQAATEDRGFFGTITFGRIGIEASKEIANYQQVTPARALRHGVEETWRIVSLTLRYVGRLFVGAETVNQLGGIGSMAKVAGDAAAVGLGSYLHVIAFLSVSIGLINLFPIPMLDGGHLVFYAIEAVRRRPLGPNAQEWAFRFGFALVLMLMFIGNWNDVLKGLAVLK